MRQVRGLRVPGRYVCLCSPCVYHGAETEVRGIVLAACVATVGRGYLGVIAPSVIRDPQAGVIWVPLAVRTNRPVDVW